MHLSFMYLSSTHMCGIDTFPVVYMYSWSVLCTIEQLYMSFKI